MVAHLETTTLAARPKIIFGPRKMPQTYRQRQYVAALNPNFKLSFKPDTATGGVAHFVHHFAQPGYRQKYQLAVQKYHLRRVIC